MKLWQHIKKWTKHDKTDCNGKDCQYNRLSCKRLSIQSESVNTCILTSKYKFAELNIIIWLHTVPCDFLLYVRRHFSFFLPLPPRDNLCVAGDDLPFTSWCMLIISVLLVLVN